jgi:hypothetical protein
MSKLRDELAIKLPQLSGQSRLYALACELSRKYLPSEAANRLATAAQRDRALLAALAETYLQTVRADMSRAAASEKDEARGQVCFDARDERAPASSDKLPAEGATQAVVPIHAMPLPLAPFSQLPGGGHSPDGAHGQPAFSRQTQEDGAGQSWPDTLETDAPSFSPVVSRGGRRSLDAQRLDAPSAGTPIPVPSRGVSAMAAVQGIMAKSIVFRLQDGRDIMEVQFRELDKIARQSAKIATAYARQAVVAQYLIEHCPYANPDPGEKVGSYFPVKTIELAIAHADKKEAVT